MGSPPSHLLYPHTAGVAVKTAMGCYSVGGHPVHPDGAADWSFLLRASSSLLGFPYRCRDIEALSTLSISATSSSTERTSSASCTPSSARPGLPWAHRGYITQVFILLNNPMHLAKERMEEINSQRLSQKFDLKSPCLRYNEENCGKLANLVRQVWILQELQICLWLCIPLLFSFYTANGS
jgi:hypothetical protein